MLTFDALRRQNAQRHVRWSDDQWSGGDWSNAMCGEAGEAANVVKKLRRHETGGVVQYNTPSPAELHGALGMELADVVIYADLLALYYNVDLGHAVTEKFNLVSMAQGFPERLTGSFEFEGLTENELQDAVDFARLHGWSEEPSDAVA